MLKRTVFNPSFLSKNIAITYIAFIECTLKPSGQWHNEKGILYDIPTGTNEILMPKGNDAEMALVDIKNDRRYFKFNNHGAHVRIISNVVIFDNDDTEEISIDDSKKFPNKKRIDE